MSIFAAPRARAAAFGLQAAATLAWLISGAPAGFAQSETPDNGWAAYIERAATLVITPRFAALESAATTLSATLDAFCAAPSDTGRIAAVDAFEDTAIAWAQVMNLPLDPVLKDNRRERFFFWPDPRGITLRQIQPVIADLDPSVTDPATLAGKSVALQGLSALEYLLFGTGFETLLAASEDGEFRCRYAVAIGHSLAGIAGAMAEETAATAAFTQRLIHPGPDNPLYPTLDSVMVDMVIGTEESLVVARDALLLPTLGLSIELARPGVAPLRRSGLTFAFLTALIDAAEGMVWDTDLAALIPPEASWIIDSIATQFAAVDALLPAPGTPIDAVTDTIALRDTLFDLAAHADNLRSLLSLSVPRVLGISGAFFASEGL